MTNTFGITFLRRLFAPNVVARSPRRSQSARRQSGTATAVTLAFATVLSIGLMSIYYTTKQVVIKRELVNAADAAAYSGATIIAQGLNYTASTNRAILANHALIGQMVSIRSTLAMSEWYWKNTAVFYKAINSMTRPFPWLAPITAVATGFEVFARVWSKGAVFPMRLIANMLQKTSSIVIASTNHAIWLSQQAHLAESLASFEPHMIRIAKANAPKAEPDYGLHFTVFGPAVTLFNFVLDFQIKRPPKRTLDKTEYDEVIEQNVKNRVIKKDEYFNYITGINRNVATAAYVGGRSAIPHAMGLWTNAGCREGEEFVESTAFLPPAGTNADGDRAINVMRGLLSVLGTLGEGYFCMYNRHGGTEIMQLKDGKYVWLAADSLSLNVPLLSQLNAYFGNRPMASGGVLSFGAANEEKTLDSLEDFRNYVTRNGRDKKYLGHQVALPADCVETVVPGETARMVALSDNTRTSGRCAALATGFENRSVDKGLFGGPLAETTARMWADYADNKPSWQDDVAEWAKSFAEPLNTASNNVRSEVGNRVEDAAVDALDAAAPNPPGLTSGNNAANTRMPTAGAVGRVTSDFLKTGFRQGATAFRNAGLRGLRSIASPSFDIGGAVEAIANEVMSEVSDPYDIGVDARQILRDMKLDDVILWLQMATSDGFEVPNDYGNKGLRLLSDGLPYYFWDVRILRKNQGATVDEEDDLVSTDEEPDNYNQRRYNLGPLVYLPLKQPAFTIRTSTQQNLNGKTIVIPNTEPSSLYKDPPSIAAMGKARIFFRQPSDQWMNRYKVVVNKSLLLPYWQVRNESLGYIEKWSLLLLQGIDDAYKDNRDTSYDNLE